MNNPGIFLFLMLSFLSTGVAAGYDEVQKVRIDKILSVDKSSFYMVKTDDGPIWLIHRSIDQIKYLQSNPAPEADASDLLRSTRSDIFVVKPECSCTGNTATYLEPGHPVLKGTMPGGFICEEDVSFFDMAGRVIASTCNAKDLTIPKYKVIDDEYIEIDPNDT